MSTTNGNLNTLKVTDKQGNVYVLLPVDTDARQEIDEAKNIQFDGSYFTAEEDYVNKEVNIGLNGVPIGVESPLKFSQDTAQGIVLGTDSPYSTVIAPEYVKKTYVLNEYCMHGNKLYWCSTEIAEAEDWNENHWTESDLVTLLTQGYATKDEVATKQDALPTSVANQYLITDDNNDLAWESIPTIEPAKVHILSKDTGFTVAEFDEMWNWVSNGHIVAFWHAIDSRSSLYISRQRHNYGYGDCITFVYDKFNPSWNNSENYGVKCYTCQITKKSSSVVEIFYKDKVVIPDPVNKFQQVLYSGGSGSDPVSWIDAFRVISSDTSSFTAKSGQSNMLTVNSSRGCLGAGTALHKYLMLDESNVTDSSDDGKLVCLDYNDGNFKLGLCNVSEVPPVESGDEDTFLRVNDQGVPSWNNPFAKSSWGTILTDTENNPILDEQDNPIFDENKVDLWTTLDGVGIGAERAVADITGNSLTLTIESGRVKAIGGKPIGVGVEMTDPEVAAIVDLCKI